MDTLVIIAKIERLFDQFDYLIVFFSSLIEITPFGWIIPGGLVLATAGFFTYNKAYALAKILVSGWLGAWFSLVGAYILGKRTGMWLVKKLKQEKNAQRAKRMLDKNGPIILTSSMLANLTRFWSAYVAGVEKYSFLRFLIYSGAASFTWVALMVFIGFLGGSERGQIENLLRKTGAMSWIILGIVGIIIFLSIKSDKKENENNSN